MKKALIILLILFSPIILQNVVPWFLYVVNPYAPAISGVVVLTNTQKPIPNINVGAEWNIAYPNIGGGTQKKYKVYYTITNANGRFNLPAIRKPFPFFLFPLYGKTFGGLQIRTYNNDFMSEVIHLKDKKSEIKISVRPYKNADEFVNAIADFPEQFLKDAIKIFNAKYSYDDLSSLELSKMSRIYNRLGQYDNEKKILELWRKK